MSHKLPAVQFNDLPDAAMIQIRPLVGYIVLPYSATTIWRLCRIGKFPHPLKVTSGITAWRVGDIRMYLEAIGNPTKGEAK